MHQNYLENLLKHRILGLSLTVFYLMALKWKPSICISNKFPNDADAAGPRTSKEHIWKIARLKQDIIAINGGSNKNL